MTLLARWTTGGHRCAKGFSLFELVMVIVILGVLSAIAVPRVSQAVERSRDSAIVGSLRVLTQAVDYYAAEHGDRTPAHNPNRTITTNGSAFVTRLTQNTDELGTPAADGLYGPYLLRAPTNPNNQLATIRVNGAPAGANTHGWRFDTASRVFQADDSERTAGIKIQDGSVLRGSASVAQGEATAGMEAAVMEGMAAQADFP